MQRYSFTFLRQLKLELNTFLILLLSCLQARAWWHMPVTLALRKLRLEGYKLKSSLRYTERPHVIKTIPKVK